MNLEENIKLGGNIELEGFNEINKPEMVIVKKMVGSYAKEMSEKNTGFKGLKVALSQESHFKINAEMACEESTLNSENENNNLFIAIDLTLKDIISQI